MLRKAIKEDYDILFRIINYLPINFNRVYNGYTTLQFAINSNQLYFIMDVANTGITDLQINSQDLNGIIQEGPFAGVSVAFWLALSRNGQQILAANNYALTRLITKQTLNYIHTEGTYTGDSIVSLLSTTLAGVAILSAHSYELGMKISHKTLNIIAIETHRIYNKTAIAFRFAKFTEGLALLAANDCELGKKISLTTLNTIPNYNQDSLSDLLRKTQVGYEILHTNNNTRNNKPLSPLLLASLSKHLDKYKEKYKKAAVSRLPTVLVREVAITLGAKPVKLVY